MALAGTWASLSDVTTYTGKTVTSTQLDVAQTMIEGLIKRIYRSTDSTTSSYYWLRRAVSFQAAYVAAHPDIFNQLDFVSMTQDGFSVTYPSGEKRIYLYSSTALSMLNNMFHGSNNSIRFNSAFQKSQVKRGLASWTSI